jgi:hypothetical protein
VDRSRLDGSKGSLRIVSWTGIDVGIQKVEKVSEQPLRATVWSGCHEKRTRNARSKHATHLVERVRRRCQSVSFVENDRIPGSTLGVNRSLHGGIDGGKFEADDPHVVRDG